MEEDECLSMIHDFQILKPLNTNTWQQMNEIPRTAASFRAYFSISHWETAVKATGRANISLLFIRTSKHADRQANVCVHKHYSKGERQRSSRHPLEFDYGLDSTPSFVLQLILAACACIWVILCAQPGQRVCVDVFVQMTLVFVLVNPCLPLREMTALVTLIFWVCFF